MLTISLKRRSPIWHMVLILILTPFLLYPLKAIADVLDAARYIMDIAWFVLLVCIFLQRNSTNKKGFTLLGIWVVLFLLYTFFVYIVQFQSPLYYIWGVRNNFRFYVAFFAFTVFLKREDVHGYLKLFDWMFWINFLVSLVQYFWLDYSGDFLGGMFGVEKGGNAYNNIFLLIMATKSIVLYLSGKERFLPCLCKCGASLLLAALAELKFYFVEFILVVVMAMLFTRFTWRKLLVILGAVIGVLVFAVLLTDLFPNFAGWFSAKWFLESALSNKGYTSAGDLNRLNAIFQINELWLKNGWDRAFGMGLGNCDTSQFTLLNTPFFEKYGDMHYIWLSYAMIYLETGWIGLMFFWGFYVLVYFRIMKIEKRSDADTRIYCRIARIMAILCVIITVYNSSLRTESGYMAYFVLALPFTYRKKNGEIRKWKSSEWING